MADVAGKLFSYGEGSYGHRVRVFARRGRRNLYIEFWDPKAGKAVPRSLQHSDEELARRQCRDISDSLRLGVHGSEAPAPPASAPEATMGGTGQGSEVDHEGQPSLSEATPVGFIGWKTLFRLHYKRRGESKKGSGPAEEKRRAKLWVAYFRQANIDRPEAIDEDDLRLFVRQRIAGEIRTPLVKCAARVSSQTAWADLVFLVSVLNWATRAKNPAAPGSKLLARNDARVPPGLKNKNPRRPRVTHDDMLALRRGAKTVDKQGLYRHFERLHDILGWRVTGMASISAADVSLEPAPGMPYGYVQKNAQVDKEGCGDRIPLPLRGHVVLRRILRIRGIEAGEKAYLFPSPSDPKRPWSRWLVRNMMERAAKCAGIQSCGGTHAVRRKWASERKKYPTPDVMKAGGWRDIRSLLVYMEDDTASILEVLSQPTNRIRKG